MKKLTTTLAILIALVAVPAALASGSLYRSDAAAQKYLEHGLRKWDHINLRDPNTLVTALCMNGYYSKHEQRTGKHYPQGHGSPSDPLFRSFSCTLSVGSHTFNLYLVTRKRGLWRVMADR